MAVDAQKPHFLLLATNGSGITTALDIFSDFGYLTVAGVDPEQMHNTMMPLSKSVTPVVFTLRLSPDMDASAIVSAVDALKTNLANFKIFTLDAPAEVLVQRYMASGKRHPFENGSIQGLQEAVDTEKKLFEPLKKRKDYSIDTSTTTATELRHKIGRVLGYEIDNQEFTVNLTTFGFKYGLPQDAELVFDMRFMTNPFYDEALRPLSGLDQPVKDFIFALDHARSFFDKWSALVAEMLPLYQQQGKTRLTIAVGCTGGKHRSVCMAEALSDYLKAHCPGCDVVVTHREMLKWGPAATMPSQSPCAAGGA